MPLNKETKLNLYLIQGEREIVLMPHMKVFVWGISQRESSWQLVVSSIPRSGSLENTLQSSRTGVSSSDTVGYPT